LGAADHGPALSHLVLDEGDSLVLYTDGVTEATRAGDEEYGVERLAALLARCCADSPQDLIRNCLADLGSFLQGEMRSDDLTILALQRAAPIQSQPRT
jgi:phosphoserine phosphatase RsbU/P